MSYVVREPETADICRESREISGKKLNILHETETVGKQCSNDSDEQLEDQFSQERL